MSLPTEYDAFKTSLSDAKRRMTAAKASLDEARHEAFTFVCKNKKAAWKRIKDKRPTKIIWTNIGREIQQVGIIVSPSSTEQVLNIDEFLTYFYIEEGN